MSNEFKQEKYFIAYFDILGYESKIDKERDQTDEKLIKAISICKQHLDNVLGEESEIRWKMFSDNFLFCTKQNWKRLVKLVSRLQMYFTTKNLFIRGAMCYESMYYSSDFVYGKGLVDAHCLENSVAIVPRIIIDDSYMNGADEIEDGGKIRKHSVREFLLESNWAWGDFDNNIVLNYLEVTKSVEVKASRFHKYLEKHAKCIETNLNTTDRRLLQKYQWAKQYHNSFCKKNGYAPCVIAKNNRGIYVSDATIARKTDRQSGPSTK